MPMVLALALLGTIYPIVMINAAIGAALGA